MSAAAPAAAAPPPEVVHAVRGVGPIGRLGRWTATHRRTVAISWLVVVVGLGAFAPRVEKALSGAGWQASGSESVIARDLVQANFGGQSSNGLMVVLHSSTRTAGNPAFAAAVARATAILRSDARVASIQPPAPGLSISRDGHTAIIRAGAAADPTAMVQAADALKGKLEAAGGDGIRVYLTGASAMWSDFNTANRNAMMKSELYSWPVTLAILALAFGALVAAGLPLMLTIVGLVAAAGSLWIASQVGEVSIWAMNFALMFALALGIDYALFIVNRFRGALFGSKLDPVDAVAVTMDTAGKAVLFSGATVLVSLSAVMLVPSPAFRSMALGIMLAVVFILAASLTLLPATLAKLGPKVDKGALRWVHSGEHRSPAFTRWAETALAASHPLRRRRAHDPRRPGLPDPRAEDRHAVDQGRSRRGLIPAGLCARPASLRPRRARAASDRRPERRRCCRLDSARPRPRHRPRLPAPDEPERRADAPRSRSEAGSVQRGRRPHHRPAPLDAPRRERWSAAPPPRTTTSNRRSTPRPRS